MVRKAQMRASQVCASGDLCLKGTGYWSRRYRSGIERADSAATCHPPAELFHRLAALVPDEVLPRVSDTAHTLRLRLVWRALVAASGEVESVTG